MLLVQQDDFLTIRESGSWAHGLVCFYSPEGGEVSEYTCPPADCWWKRGLRIHLLGGCGCIRPLCGWGEEGAGRRTPGCAKWRRGHYNEMGGVMIKVRSFFPWPEASSSSSLKCNRQWVKLKHKNGY